MQLHRLSIGLLLGSLASLAILGACGKNDSAAPTPRQEAPETPASAPRASQALKEWQGTWFGPEGTHLRLTAKTDSTYEIAIRDLDAERTFEGVGRGDRIHFTRDGREETVRATNGDATGMKWLAGKSNCLTVKQGEGYCRD